MACWKILRRLAIIRVLVSIVESRYCCPICVFIELESQLFRDSHAAVDFVDSAKRMMALVLFGASIFAAATVSFARVHEAVFRALVGDSAYWQCLRSLYEGYSRHARVQCARVSIRLQRGELVFACARLVNAFQRSYRHAERKLFSEFAN